MKRLWTKTEEEYLSNNFNKQTYQEIADILNRPLASIENKARSMKRFEDFIRNL